MPLFSAPCPICDYAPVTEEVQEGGFRTLCRTEGCKCMLVALGPTKEASVDCWNRCVRKGDF